MHAWALKRGLCLFLLLARPSLASIACCKVSATLLFYAQAAKNMTQMADGLDDAGVEALMQALHARTAKSGSLSIDHTGKQFVRETQ